MPALRRAAFLSAVALAPAARAYPAHAQPAPVKVLCTDVFTGVLDRLFAEFGRVSGTRVTVSYATSEVARSRLASGAAADVAILPRPALQQLEKAGKIRSGSIAPLGRSQAGIAVRPEAPIPIFVTLDDFTATLVSAKAISYPNPAGGSETGIWFAAVLERLGIAQRMQAKTVFAPAGRGPADLVAHGDVALAVDQPLNIFRVPDASLVAFVPQQLHGPGEFTFSIAPLNGAANPRAARALVAYVRRPASIAAIRERGLDPA